MTTVADLNIKVDVDGAATAAAELTVLGERVDEVGDEASGAAAKFDILGASMTALKVVGVAGAIGGLGGLLGSLTAGAGGLVAALGGAGVAVGGIAAIGATMGVAAAQALKLKYGTESVGEAFEKLMQQGPIQEAMRSLNAEFRKLGDGVERFLLEVIPAGINVFETFVSKVGPYMEDIATAISKEAFEWADIFGKALDTVLPHVAGWMKGLSDILQPFFKSLIPAAVPGMNGLLTVLGGLAKGLTAIVKAGTPLIKMVTGALASGLEVLGKSLGRIVTAFGPSVKVLFEGLEVIFKGLADGLVALAPGFTAGLKGLVAGLKELRPAMKPLGEALGAILKASAPLWPIIGKLGVVIADTLAKLLPPLVPVVEALAKFLDELLTKAIAPLIAFLSRQGAQILKDIVGLFLDLMPAVMDLVPVFVDLVKASRPLIRFAVQLLRAFMPFIRVLLPPLLRLTLRLSTVFTEILTAALNALKDPLNWLADKLKAFADGWKTFKESFQRGVQVIKDWLIGLKDKIVGFFDNAITWLTDAGKAIWDGFLNGMKTAWEGVKGWFEDRWNDLKSLPGKLLEIFSPSRVMRRYGQNVVKGIYLGLQDEGTNLSKAWGDTMGRLRGSTVGVGVAALPGARPGRGRGGRDRDGDLTGTLRIVGSRDLFAVIDARVEKAMHDDTDYRTRRTRMRPSADREARR